MKGCKMKSKKKLIIFVVIILLVSVFGITIFVIKNNPKKPKEPDKEVKTILSDSEDQYGFSYVNKKRLDVCKDKDNCNVVEPLVLTLKSESKIEEVQSIVKQINQKTEEYEKIFENSTTEEPTCQSVQNIYKHSLMPETKYEMYQNENILSMTVFRYQTNLCTREYANIPIEVYVYDKNNNKILTQEEIAANNNITYDYIKEQISKKILELQAENTPRTIEDVYTENGLIKYTLYYNNMGELIASFRNKLPDSEGYYNEDAFLKK